MKIRGLLVFLALFLSVVSCSSDIDLFADPKEIPIVYGVLNSDADTNFNKNTRALGASDNPLLEAANPEQSNYPGKLDVRLTEYINGDSVRQIILDTITIHNKQPGIYYAPDQKLYYTTEPLGNNTSQELYSYRLTVELPDRTLTAFTDMVGSSEFRIQSLGVNFSKEYFGVNQNFLFRPAVNASIYDFDLAFTFREQRTPDSDSVPRTMKWHIGTYYEDDLWHHESHNMYYFTYRPENFWEYLENFIGGDTCIPGLTRMLSDQAALVTVTAGGRNLQDYMQYTNVVSEHHPSEYAYSNIEGAVGVFSSKMTRTQHVGLGGTTMPSLIADKRWGFKYIGGHDP